MGLDVVLLSRLQFALTIMFHYLFPPLTIGMGLVLVYLEGMHLWRRDPLYHAAAKFWTRIFALNFALGVTTGIVMEFQFGTNWATYSRFVGDVFGSALAAEGIFAFFLESGFLAVLVFGWDRVSKPMHFFATCMVFLGSMFSAIWIVVANSWQQTPAGHHIVQMQRDGQPWFIDGEPVMRAEILDFWAMVFNPSSMHRLIHVWLGCFIMGAFFILSIAAWYLLHNRHQEFARRSLRGALLVATVSSIAILISGDLQAKNVYEHQPAKLAAFEGHFKTGPADLTLFGIPDADDEEMDFNVAIPGGISFLLFDDFNAPVTGLDRFHPDDRPPVQIPFWSFHLMVGIGTFFIVLTLASCYWLFRGTIWSKRWLLWIFVFSVVPAVIANQAGWVAAEVGRQPWIVHPPVQRDGMGQLRLSDEGFVQYDEVQGLRTSEAVSEAVKADQVLASIVGFGLLYVLLGFVWVFVLHHKIQQGPEPDAKREEEAPKDGHRLLETAAERVAHHESMTEAKAAPEETEGPP